MSGIHAASVFHENFSSSTMNNPFRKPSPLFYRVVSKCIPIFHQFFFFLKMEMASNEDSIFFFFFSDENVILSFVPLFHVSMEKTKDRNLARVAGIFD